METIITRYLPTDAITRFRFPFNFLSNFYHVDVEYDGVKYPTLEHAYQAAKCAKIDDRKGVLCYPTAGQAKRWGRQVKMRRDWEQIKTGVMMDLLRFKFEEHLELATQLKNTGDRMLIEGNDWGDRFWGMEFTGTQDDKLDCHTPALVGENMLGKLLMKLRSELA